MSEETRQNLLSEFDEVCKKYLSLTKVIDHDSAPLLAGVIRTNLFLLFRRPIKNMRIVFRLYTVYTGVNDVGAFFPVERMIEALEKYSVPQLNSLKKISEINVKSQTERSKNNPIFKLGAGLGIAYGLIKTTIELSGADSMITGLQKLLGFSMQPIINDLLKFIVISIPFLFIQYFFFIWPRLIRAKLLDDVLQIAIEQRYFEQVGTTSEDSNDIRLTKGSN